METQNSKHYLPTNERVLYFTVGTDTGGKIYYNFGKKDRYDNDLQRFLNAPSKRDPSFYSIPADSLSDFVRDLFDKICDVLNKIMSP